MTKSIHTVPVEPEFSITNAIADAHNKRKRDFIRQASQTSIDDEVRCHKRSNSRNNASIFRTAAQDVEERQEPDDDDEEEVNLVNAYRSRNEVHQHDGAAHAKPEPLDLPSPKNQECDYMTFSPVSSFFHPAIMRATTICESASDIFCGEPPEVESRPCSPQQFGEATTACNESILEEKKERDAPSWLTSTPAFSWSISKSNASPSPWSGVFQLGSS